MNEVIQKFIPAIIVGTLIVILYGGLKYYEYKKNKKKITNEVFPPYKSECPDFWKVIGKNKCRRIHGIGLPKCSPPGHSPMKHNIVDFNREIYTKGKIGNKNKCNWSKECQTPWEGYDDLCI